MLSGHGHLALARLLASDHGHPAISPWLDFTIVERIEGIRAHEAEGLRESMIVLQKNSGATVDLSS